MQQLITIVDLPSHPDGFTLVLPLDVAIISESQIKLSASMGLQLISKIAAACVGESELDAFKEEELADFQE